MTRPAQPLRFLALVLGAWVAGRASFLVPQWLVEAPGPVRADLPDQRFILPGPVPTPMLNPVARPALVRPFHGTQGDRLAAPPPTPARTRLAARSPMPAIAVASHGSLTGMTPPALASPGPIAPEAAGLAWLPRRTVTAQTRPWSVSAWALLRGGPGQGLAAGGLLGGSQIGARLTYPLRDRLALSARAYAPIERPRGAEVALGIEWQPSGGVPVRLLAERRQAIGRDGRSAFALLAHGGIGAVRLIGPLRFDGYAQAGIVGLRAADLFADGSARIGLPVTDEFAIGAGAWGGAQPGAARFDLGPELSYRMPNTPLRISAGYRVRVAGDAAPGSGPSLTLAADF